MAQPSERTLANILGYSIKNKKLEWEARTHPENRRLALVGDSALDLYVLCELCDLGLEQGVASKAKSDRTNNGRFSNIVIEQGLAKYMKITGGAAEQASMRATFLEALFGAIVQDCRQEGKDVFETVAQVAQKLGI